MDTEISLYTQYISQEKKFSKHTILAYANDLKDFQSFIFLHYQISDIKEVSHHFIRDWVSQYVENNMEASSIRRKLSTLRSFYKFLLKNEIVSSNEAAKITSIKLKKRLPSAIDESENVHLDVLMKQDFDKDYSKALSHFIILFLYGTGIRRSELIDLKKENIDFGQNTIKVLGKRQKERIIPLPDILMQKTKVFIEMFGEVINKNIYLFLDKKGKKLDPKAVYNMVKAHLNTITNQKKKSPHVLRHSYATHLLENGAQINDIKELLGHSSLAATQIYTNNSISKLKEVYKNAHPLSNKTKFNK